MDKDKRLGKAVEVPEALLASSTLKPYGPSL